LNSFENGLFEKTRENKIPTKIPAKSLLMKKSSKKKAAEPEAGGVKDGGVYICSC
jgi:hypothetical protein